MSLPRLSQVCPAKLNLFLAITGRRADGFHDLVSVVVPLALADRLTAEVMPGLETDTLRCPQALELENPDNLVLKAARAYRERNPLPWPLCFTLEKHLPTGAGLGGGSSDAAGALRLLNQLAAQPLPEEQLLELAAQVGSDCPLFLMEGPVLMRGRGELLERLPESFRRQWSGQEVMVIKPAFGVPTAWAYQEVARHEAYLPPAEAEAAVRHFLAASSANENAFFNSFLDIVGRKYLTLLVMINELQKRGLQAGLSGSGSALFVRLSSSEQEAGVRELVAKAWGERAFVAKTNIL